MKKIDIVDLKNVILERKPKEGDSIVANLEGSENFHLPNYFSLDVEKIKDLTDIKAVLGALDIYFEKLTLDKNPILKKLMKDKS